MCDAFFLAVELLTDFDHILLDMLGEEIEDFVPVAKLGDDVFDENGVLLADCQIELQFFFEGLKIIAGLGESREFSDWFRSHVFTIIFAWFHFEVLVDAIFGFRSQRRHELKDG